MLRRNITSFLKVLFIVLFIFFVITTQFASRPFKSVTVGIRPGRESASLIIDDRLLSELEKNQTQHRLITTTNKNTMPKNAVEGKEGENETAETENGKLSNSSSIDISLNIVFSCVSC